MQYSLAQAKARLCELTSLVDSGEEVVISEHGRPSYKLILMSGAQADSVQATPFSAVPTGHGRLCCANAW